MIECRKLHLPALAVALCLAACAGAMKTHTEQGLQGAFSTYGPPLVFQDCNPLVTQAEKDSCRHMNNRVIEEPYQGSFMVRNLSTRETVNVTLDAEGKYKVQLTPGEYEICVSGECSDPITVRMSAFEIYGQRLPRAVPESTVSKPAKPGKAFKAK